MSTAELLADLRHPPSPWEVYRWRGVETPCVGAMSRRGPCSALADFSIDGLPLCRRHFDRLSDATRRLHRGEDYVTHWEREHDEFVYFGMRVDRRDMLKIGTSYQPMVRLTSLGLTPWIIVRGGRQVEAAFHREFDALRIKPHEVNPGHKPDKGGGSTEWFWIEPPLIDFIAAVRDAGLHVWGRDNTDGSIVDRLLEAAP